jgi:hypothetical protein
MKFMILIFLVAFPVLEAVNTRVPMLEEETQNYIVPGVYEEQAIILEEEYMSMEEQQAERDAIIKGGAVDYDVNLFATEDGFRLSLFMIYSDGSKLNMWEHLAREFNKKIPVENLVQEDI